MTRSIERRCFRHRRPRPGPSTDDALTPNYGGPHAGQIWTPWETPSAAAAGHVKAQFVATAVGTQKGVVMEAYEYQRYQTSSKPFWTPIRFAGQYYDAESDLAENWNRFYDSNIGRFLETEPMLTRPGSSSAYTYAAANPLGFADPTGQFRVGPAPETVPFWSTVGPHVPIGIPR